MKIDTQSPALPRTTPSAPPERNRLAVDGRFKPFSVNHTDSRGREGMYVDQSSPFKALGGADGKPKAVAYTAGFAVDTDGVGSHHGDSTADNLTSLKVGGRSADADKLPYVALPPGLAKSMGAKLGDLVQVTTPNGKTAFGLYADNSDDRQGRKLGEGSPALLGALGYKGSTLDPNKGGLDAGVKFVAFPGSGAALGTTAKGFPTSEQVQAMGKQWAAQVGGSAAPAKPSSPATPPSDTMTTPSAPSKPGPVAVHPGDASPSSSLSSAPSLREVAQGQGSFKLGQRGEDIKQLQQMLGMSGKAVDGVFGEHTEQAVTRFQKAQGLEADGKVGTHTLAALQDTSLLKPGASGEQVQALQQQLQKAGFDPGPIDGQFGGQTEAAVKQLQQARGLEVDGVVGPRTQEALGHGATPATPAPAKPTPATPTPATPTPASGAPQWTPAPSLADVQGGKAVLKQGMQGAAVSELQKQLGLEPDGKFGQQTADALGAFQKANGLKPPPGMEGQAGKTTLEALKKAGATSATGGAVLGNGVRIDTNNPILKKLATAPLNDGPTGYCVATTLENMQRLGIPHTPEATGQDPNNPRGGMAQMLRNGGWASVPFPGAHQESIRSPYGNTTANVVSADQYRKLVADGKVPSGAIIFQSRHGWGWNEGSKGNDMGIVRDHGQQTHNYQTMSSIIYADCKSVVILVPKDALKTT